MKETSPLASTHTLSTDLRAELRAAYTPRAGGAPAETAPEVAAAATCFQAADAAAVLRMRPKTNTKSAVIRAGMHEMIRFCSVLGLDCSRKT